LSEVVTETHAMRDARRSLAEWIASEMMPTDPDRKPTASFSSTRVVLDTTETAAARLLGEMVMRL